MMETLSAGGVTHAVAQYSYDAEGRLDCTAQRMNPTVYASLPASACTPGTAGSFGPDRISKTVYDAADRVSKVQAGVGIAVRDVVTNAYTANGQLASVADAVGNKTSYDYDGFDRLSKTRFPDGVKGSGVSSTTDYEQLGYDPAGNVTSRRLRDGTSIALSYDNLNRLTLKDLPGTEPDVSYAYDNLGRLTSVTRPDIAHSLTYDALGRLTSEQQPFGLISYQYDLAGRRTRTTWFDGFYVDYDYLVTGEVTKIRENGATTGVGVLATYGYDDLGRRTSLTRGNGLITSYGYDPVSRLASLTQDLAGTLNDLTLGFTYNPAGQIATATRSNDLYSWTEHVDVNRAYTANSLNQYTLAGTIVPTYDTKGNLTSAGPVTYGYSSENLLKSTSDGITLHYDGFGRLAEYDTTVSTRFLYDGGVMVAEIDNPSGAILRRYVHCPGIDEPLVWYEGAGTSDRRFLHADERGSIIAVTDGAGAVIAINTYDEYGIPGSTNQGRFQYTGQTWLPELGMYYYKARIYSPTLGRFLQTDPIGYGGGINMYAYVGGDPVNMADPTGLTPVAKHEIVTGSRIHQDGSGGGLCTGCSGTVNGGVWTGGRGGVGEGGTFHRVGPNYPGIPLVDANGEIYTQVTSSFVWVPTVFYFRPVASPMSVVEPALQKEEPKPCTPPKPSTLSRIANMADDFSDASAGLALGSLGLAAVTSETIVGGVTFGGLSAGLGALSALGAGVSATAKYFDGNTRGAVSTGAGAVAGLIVPPAMGRGLKLTTGGERLVAGAAGEGYGRMTSSIICGGN